jgi:hypothetical protein
VCLSARRGIIQRERNAHAFARLCFMDTLRQAGSAG